MVGCTTLLFANNTEPFITIMALLVCYFFADEFDGYLARSFNACSKFGAVFDNYTDRYADTIFCIYFLHMGSLNIGILALLLIRLCLNEAWDGSGHNKYLLMLWSFAKSVFWMAMFLDAPDIIIYIMSAIVVYGCLDHLKNVIIRLQKHE